MPKHYIRIDDQSRIIRGFSTDFEQPEESDICINEDAGRHFEINGIINPSLSDGNSVCLFKYENNQVVQRIDDEIQIEISNLSPPPPTELELLKTQVTDLEDQILVLMGV